MARDGPSASHPRAHEESSPCIITPATGRDQARDITLLVNNAGLLGFGGVLDGDLDLFHRDVATNYLGTLRVTRAFVPVPEANGPAAIVTALTLIARAPVAPMAGYCASKAVAHSMTQALRADCVAAESR